MNFGFSELGHRTGAVVKRRIITMNQIAKIRSLKSSAAVPKPFRDGPGFSGTTLTEILMALMVMGIGLVSVASLFPISMLRSAQATKLTNAVLLKLQCEDIIQALPNLARDDYDASYPTPNRILDNVEFTPRSVAWPRYEITNLIQLKNFNVVAVIDPIGALYNFGSPDAKSYGKDPYNLHGGSASIFRFSAVRKNAGFNFSNSSHKESALSLFGSNDSWKSFTSSIEVTVNSPTEVVLLDAKLDDLTVFADSLSSGSVGRIVLVDINGKQSHVSQVAPGAITGQTVTLSAPLPNNGLYSAISEVRLELFELRYSCLITIRKQLISLGRSFPFQPGDTNFDDDGNGTPDDFSEIGWRTTRDPSGVQLDDVQPMGGDLVVFFRRDFSPLAEQVYSVENMNKGQVGVQPGDVTIRWAGNPEAKPRLREGGWVFDPQHGYWYQIRSVNEVGADFALILLDRPAEVTGQYLMVPENVVNVVEFTAY